MSHEGSCCIASIVLLNETYSRIHNQQEIGSPENPPNLVAGLGYVFHTKLYSKPKMKKIGENKNKTNKTKPMITSK
jgi:hypothetical protein